MFSAVSEFGQRHWLGLTRAIPVAVFAACIASMVVPATVKTVVPEVVRTVLGSEAWGNQTAIRVCQFEAKLSSSSRATNH